MEALAGDVEILNWPAAPPQAPELLPARTSSHLVPSCHASGPGDGCSAARREVVRWMNGNGC